MTPNIETQIKTIEAEIALEKARFGEILGIKETAKVKARLEILMNEIEYIKQTEKEFGNE